MAAPVFQRTFAPCSSPRSLRGFPFTSWREHSGKTPSITRTQKRSLVPYEHPRRCKAAGYALAGTDRVLGRADYLDVRHSLAELRCAHSTFVCNNDRDFVWTFLPQNTAFRIRKLHRGSRKGRSLSDPAIRRDADRRMDALRHRALPCLHRLAFHFAGFVSPVGTHNMRHTFHCDRLFLDDLRYDRCRFPWNIHGSWHPLRHDCCGYRQRVLFW